MDNEKQNWLDVRRDYLGLAGTFRRFFITFGIIIGIFIVISIITVVRDSTETTRINDSDQTNLTSVEQTPQPVQTNPSVSIGSAQSQNAAVVKITGIGNNSFTFSDFEITKKGNLLNVNVRVKNTGKYEDMLDLENLVIKTGTENSIRPVNGYVGDPMIEKNVKDWRNILADDSTVIFAQFNVKNSDSATKYDLFYVYAGEKKRLYSFSKDEIKQEVEQENKFEQKAQTNQTPSSIPFTEDIDNLPELRDFTASMNQQFPKYKKDYYLQGWRKVGYAPSSYDIKYNNISVGVHISESGIDTVSILENSNEKMSEIFFVFVTSAISSIDSSANPKDILTYLSQHLNDDEKDVTSATLTKDGTKYMLLISEMPNLQQNTTRILNFIISKDN